MKAVLGLFLFVCLSAGPLAEPAAAIPAAVLPEGNVFYPQPATVTQYKTLSGLDFHPANSQLAYTQESDGSLYPDSGSGAAQFSARLDLPSDATVSDVIFYFVDNTSPADIQFKISTFSPNGNSFDKWNFTPVRDSSSLQTVSFSANGGYPFAIANDVYSYQLLVIFGAPGGVQKLYGATIAYTESGDLPTNDHVTLVGSDFHPSISDIIFASSGPGVYCASDSPTCGAFLAPIYLPQGSQVTQVDYYLVDNNSSYNLTMQINGFSPLTNNLATWGAGSTFGYEPSDTILMISKSVSITIDNATRSYAVLIQPTMTSMEQMLLGARIHFTPAPASNFRVRTLAGYDFQPNLSKVEYSTQGGTLFPEDNEPTGTFSANLDPPDGSAVFSLTVYFKKLSGASGDFTFTVKSYTPGSSDGVELESCDTSAFPTGNDLQQLSFTDTVSTLGTMDAHDNNWRLEVTPSAADDRLVLFGAQVQYAYPSLLFIPVIRN